MAEGPFAIRPVTVWHRSPALCLGLFSGRAGSKEHGAVVTALMMPDGHDAEAFRSLVKQRFNVTLGAGLGRLKGRAFRIGHPGDFNEPMLMGALCAVEMGFGARRRAVFTGAAWTPRWRGSSRSEPDLFRVSADCR